MSTTGEFVTYPVGQGLFYAGKLKNANREFNFVYDCGSQIAPPIVKCINEYNEFNKKDIDMLVISHFDKDHVSGLKKLAEGRIIKRIFLPYIQNINIDMLSYSLKTLKLKGVISESAMTNIILINETNGEDNINELPTLEDLESETPQDTPVFRREDLGSETAQDTPVFREDLNEFKISLFKKNRFKVFDWLFDFYNYPLPKAEIKSINISFNTFIHKNKIDNFDDFLKCNKFWKRFNESVYSKNIKTYKFIKGNNISLCLMHAPLNILNSNKISATLLTGDIDLSNKNIYPDFNKKFSYIASKLKVFFLPHHGSRNNWNDYLVHSYCKNTLSVATAASRSKYGHPDFEVISKIFLSKNDLVCITEKFDSYKYIIKS